MAFNQLDLNGLKKLAELGVIREYSQTEIQINESKIIFKGEKSEIFKCLVFGQEVAVKDVTARLKDYDSILGIQLHATLNHPNIAIIQGYLLQNNKLYLVLPFQSKGSLADSIYEINRLENTDQLEKIKLEILIDIAKGLLYLHSKQIIHQNLNPSNILLNDQFTAKISNFRCSTKLNTKRFFQGDQDYIAPEANLINEESTEKIDIYSLGKIAYFLLQDLQDQKERRLPKHYAFLKQCINQNPSERPTIDILLAQLTEIYRNKYQQAQEEVQRYRISQTKRVNKQLNLW